MKLFYIFLIIILPVFLVLTGCKLEEPDVKKTETDLKGQSMSRYVAIGNSLTAGVQSGSLVEEHQMYSFPKLLAGQLGITDFEQPTIAWPGNPPILTLNLLTESIEEAPGPAGDPTNLAYPQPYNNLGIPTAMAWDILNAIDSTSGYRYYLYGETNPAVDLVLRNPAFNNMTVFQQAKAQQPELITLWIGNNDALGYATSGGLKPLTSVDDFTHPVTGMPMQGFQNTYSELMDSIATLTTLFGTKVAVANIPDVTSIPFFKTVGPGIAQSLSANSLPGIVFEKGSDDLATAEATGSATLADLAGFNVLVTLTGASYASLIGTYPCGQWYRDLASMQGVTIHQLFAGGAYAAVDTMQPFGLSTENPWPSALILDEEEIMLVQSATAGYNSIIESMVNARGYAFFDAYFFLGEIAEEGLIYQGRAFSSDFISVPDVPGGLFSLDGVHVTNAGYAIVANKFIEAINETYDVEIAPVMLSDVLTTSPKLVRRVNVKHDLKSLSSTIEMLGGRFW